MSTAGSRALDEHEALLEKRSARSFFAGLSKKERGAFSLSRVIDALINGRAVAPFEAEISDEITRTTGQQAKTGNSLLVPLDVLQRDLTAANASGGGYVVGTSTGPAIDAFRPMSITERLGVQRLTGLVGNVSLPTIATGSSANWISSEGVSATESTPTTQQIAMTPKICSTTIDCSRSLLLQPNADEVVRRDLLGAANAALDAAAIAGTGASGQPTGIINTVGINAIAGASITWSGVLDFIVNASVAGGNCSGFAMRSAVYKLLASREKAAGSGFIAVDGLIDGRPVALSENVSAATIVGGDWSQVVIGEWNALDLSTDPFGQFKSRLVSIRVWSAVDIAIRNRQAFSVSSSVT